MPDRQITNAEQFRDRGLELLGDLGNNEDNLTALYEYRTVLVPFVGAGLSVVYDYKEWKDLLRSAARWIADSTGDSMLCAEVEKDLSRNHYEEAAEKLPGNKFDEFLRNEFGECRPALLRGAVRHLPRLAGNIVLTTNLDGVLEFVFRGNWKVVRGPSVGNFTESLNTVVQRPGDDSEHLIFKLHGDWSDSETRVLTKSEYARTYCADGDVERLDLNKPLPNAIRKVYTGRVLLFLGSSLLEDRTTAVLQAIIEEKLSNGQNKYGGITHFALLEALDGDKEKSRARLKQLERWQIRPLFFPKGAFHKIEGFLDFLANMQKENAAEPGKYYFLLSVTPTHERDSYPVILERELRSVPELKRGIKLTLLANDYGASYKAGFDYFVTDAPEESWLFTIQPEENTWSSSDDLKLVRRLAEAKKHVVCFDSGQNLLDAVKAARKTAPWGAEWCNPVLVLETNSEEAVGGLIRHIESIADRQPIPRGAPVVIITIPGPRAFVANKRRGLFNEFLSNVHLVHELARGSEGNKPGQRWAGIGDKWRGICEKLYTARLRTATTNCLKEWSEELARKEAEACLGMCDFDNKDCRVLFLCGNDQLALGAWAAVGGSENEKIKNAINEERIWFCGIDGLKRMTDLLHDHRMSGHTMTVDFGDMRNYVRRAINTPAWLDKESEPIPIRVRNWDEGQCSSASQRR